MNPLQSFISSVSKTKTASPFSNAPAASPFKPQAQQVASSPAAVGPDQTPPIAPAQQGPKTQGSARDAYVSGVAGPAAGLTEADVRGNVARFNSQNPQQTQNNGSTGVTVGSTDTGSKDAFLKSYRDYLSQYSAAVQPSAAIEEAGTRLADVQSKIDERKLKATQAYQTKLDQGGMTKAGAEQDATQYARRENADLANLAVQESAAARTLSALTGSQEAKTSAAKTMADISKPIQVGDKYYDPATGAEVGTTAKPPEGFTLSPGEVRYDSKGNQIASGGAKPMTAAQEAAQIKTQEAEKQAQQQGTQSLGIINSLLAGDTAAITGVGQNPLNAFGISNGKAINEYNQLQGLLKLGVRSLIKGQGAVSDYEGKILAQASSKLGRNLNNADFQQALKDIRGTIKTNSGQSATVTVVNPAGEAITADLSGPEIYQLVSEGNTITYN